MLGLRMEGCELATKRHQSKNLEARVRVIVRVTRVGASGCERVRVGASEYEWVRVNTSGFECECEWCE